MIFDSHTNLGAAPGRNYLITHTKEEWLLFVDNDITVKTPDWLHRFESHVATNQGAEVLVPRLFIVNENGHMLPYSIRLGGGKVNFEFEVVGNTTNAFPEGASFVNRRVFNRLGLYDDTMFVGFAGWELSIRGILSGKPIAAKLMPDIEFTHEHRPALSDADRQAALVRYDSRLLENSFNRVLEKHGVLLPNWRIWASRQRTLTANRGIAGAIEELFTKGTCRTSEFFEKLKGRFNSKKRD
jgi:hypothetical protein